MKGCIGGSHSGVPSPSIASNTQASGGQSSWAIATTFRAWRLYISMFGSNLGLLFVVVQVEVEGLV